MPDKIVEKHPLAIRWFHWLNFPVIAVMAWSGLLIYWAEPVYGIKLGGKELFHFFPDWFYAPVVKAVGLDPAYQLDHRLAEGMSWHFAFFWVFAVNGLLYAAYLLKSRQWRLIAPDRRSFKQAVQVVLHDLKIRKEPVPQGKYNGAQRITYSGVIAMGAVMLLTGILMYKPVQFGFLTPLFGSYQNARTIHFAVTVLFVAFFVVHIVQVVRAGWANFRAMLTGRELVKEAKVVEESQTA